MAALGVYYNAIFRDFPVIRLRGWQYFEWDHDGNHSSAEIQTLEEFQRYYSRVIGSFEKNDFVTEYDTRFNGTADWHEHPSVGECKQKLLDLKNAIVH